MNLVTITLRRKAAIGRTQFRNCDATTVHGDVLDGPFILLSSIFRRMNFQQHASTCPGSAFGFFDSIGQLFHERFQLAQFALQLRVLDVSALQLAGQFLVQPLDGR